VAVPRFAGSAEKKPPKEERKGGGGLAEWKRERWPVSAKITSEVLLMEKGEHFL